MLAAGGVVPTINEDGTITATLSPSQWHVYNVSPDTCELFTDECLMDLGVPEDLQEQHGSSDWDDYDIAYDMKAVVRDLAEGLAEWIENAVQLAVPSARDAKVTDTWSPSYYNFTTDGFEMTLTFRLDELMAVTEGFDVDEWARLHYGDAPGFISRVPHRMTDPDWRAEYEVAWRVEYLLSLMTRNDRAGRYIGGPFGPLTWDGHYLEGWADWMHVSSDTAYDEHRKVAWNGDDPAREEA